MPSKSLLTAAAAASVLLLDVADAFGATTGENTPVNLNDGTTPNKVPGASAGGSLVRTFVGLAIVIGVIYGLYWVLKQVKSSREEKASGQGLAAVATLPLGPNRTLQLVRAGRELVLVGVAEQGVVPIRTYTEQEALDLGLTQPASTTDEPRTGGSVDGRDPDSGLVALQGRMRGLIDTVRERTVRG
jgi:flagellar protein FliO/FliZ